MTLEQRLERLERQVAEMKRKPKWTKVTEIARLTGWDRERMRRARQNGEVNFKKKGSSFFYDLDSIHPLLIKNK